MRREDGNQPDPQRGQWIDQPVLPGINHDSGLGADFEQFFALVGRAVEIDQHRVTLRITQPVGVVWNGWQAAQWSRVHGHTEAHFPHPALDDLAGQHVEHDPHLIARLDISEVVFLEISLHPDIFRGDKSHLRRSGGCKITPVQAHTRYHAIPGRTDRGALEIKLGLIERSLGL